jgi:hypothetical protein
MTGSNAIATVLALIFALEPALPQFKAAMSPQAFAWVVLAITVTNILLRFDTKKPVRLKRKAKPTTPKQDE